jgi:hypothetical protein
MDPARLRRNVTIAVAGATALVAVAIAADPLPGSPPAAVPAAAVGDEAALSARESRAAARLEAAEQYVRALAGARDASRAASAVASAPAPPVVSVAPAAPPVVSSGSS